MSQREKRPLGNLFGLKNFGVNLTRLAPGGQSALLHRHSKQDEFVYVLEGEPTLVTDIDEITLSPGMCTGFPAQGVAHQLVNRTDRDVVYLKLATAPLVMKALTRAMTSRLRWALTANGFTPTKMVGRTDPQTAR